MSPQGCPLQKVDMPSKINKLINILLSDCHENVYSLLAGATKISRRSASLVMHARILFAILLEFPCLPYRCCNVAHTTIFCCSLFIIQITGNRSRAPRSCSCQVWPSRARRGRSGLGRVLNKPVSLSACAHACC